MRHTLWLGSVQDDVLPLVSAGVTEREAKRTFVNVRFLLMKPLRKFLVRVSLDTQSLSNRQHLCTVSKFSFTLPE